MSDHQMLEGMQQLLFESPPYAIFEIPARKLSKDDNLDGFCSGCQRIVGFKCIWKDQIPVWTGDIPPLIASVICRCTRNEQHVINFYVRVSKREIQKIGQYPTYADMELGHISSFGKILHVQDRRELGRAVGLAARGVGIGSFVYVRRIFERIVRRKFDELKDERRWTEEQFKVPMEDKISLLKDDLPEIMVKQKKLYGILSKGIHELTEEECMGFFPFARSMIVYILDDEQRRKEQEAELAEVTKAISNFPS